jgi:hypothetical protein
MNEVIEIASDGLFHADTHMPAQRNTILTGHHDIEDDQVDGLAFEDSFQGRATFRNANLVALLLKILSNEIPNIVVIVNDDDMRGVLHCLASLRPSIEQ